MEDAIQVDRQVPQHVAIIMDGNGRWAKNKMMPRYVGHKAGVDSVETVVEACIQKGVSVLTLFAFSSENWQRPEKEVSLLMGLFVSALKKQIKTLHQQNIRLRVMGDMAALPDKLQAQISQGEQLTANNDTLDFVIAANYGGRWDIVQAVKKISSQVAEGGLCVDQIDEGVLSQHLSLADLPNPDLFIRTGGEFRVSNFLLWQLAYSELYFTNVLWPDFDESEFCKALDWFALRQRRYGKTGEQVKGGQ